MDDNSTPAEQPASHGVTFDEEREADWGELTKLYMHQRDGRKLALVVKGQMCVPCQSSLYIADLY